MSSSGLCSQPISVKHTCLFSVSLTFKQLLTRSSSSMVGTTVVTQHCLIMYRTLQPDSSTYLHTGCCSTALDVDTMLLDTGRWVDTTREDKY